MIPFEVRSANFLNSVSFIASKARQRAAWVDRNKESSSVITLRELDAQFFDDNDIDNFIADDLEATPLTTEQKNAVCSIRDALNDFGGAPGNKLSSSSDVNVINDPEWGNLVRLARETLILFGKQVS